MVLREIRFKFKLSAILLPGQQIGIRDEKQEQRNLNSMCQLKIRSLETLIETELILTRQSLVDVFWTVTCNNRKNCGRLGGFMVSALDSGASSLGSSPGRGHCVVFLGKALYSHGASLHTQVYTWVPANLMLGVTLR